MTNMIKTFSGFLLLTLALGFTAGCSERPPASAIASAHPLATQAGMEILDKGGNAFDAAVAVTAALGVVEPYASGLGGGGFYLLHQARSKDGDDKQVMLDAREKAPLAAHRDMYLGDDGEVIAGASLVGPLAAGVPGIPAAIDHLARNYGKLPLSISLAPAIRLARQGFKVDRSYRRYINFRLRAIQQDPQTAEIFLKWGAVPPAGTTIVQQDLASTLEIIAQKGRAGFYGGDIARKLVDGVRAAGGIWTLDDLKQYRVIERQPIIGEYRGTRIISAAPPSSGGVAIMTMLNMLNTRAQDDVTKLSSVARAHLIIEAMRRTYRDRAEFLGDTDFVAVPVKRLTSMQHARQLRDSIDSGINGGINGGKATPSSELNSNELIDAKTSTGAGNNTSHFSILDSQGNRVAATLSINYPFGASFVPKGTGVLLNDEMDDFSARPGTPNAYGLIGDDANAIEPGKRPLSSMSPTFLENDRGIAILGTSGGSRIISMVLLAILEFHEGGDAASMVSKPRFHHQYLPDRVFYEPESFSDAEQAALQAMGHTLQKVANGSHYGNMQAVVWDKKTDRITAASDKRGIGQAEVKEN
ncbi:MAG: gamma-glutamyltransferase [Gammaproteobacteria bacterium]|nr:MAG: gamma-glutamyltransferase [Gammaproteobacteria bacterium]